MKVKFQTVESYPSGYTTVGYWFWTAPQNKGQLVIQVMKMSDWRFSAAVWGHEIIEAFYCWICGITTEVADKFDDMYERGYKDGSISVTKEPGHDPKCPYHWGHMAGVVWEYVCIYGTCASWKKYTAECDRLMGILAPAS